MHRDIAALRQGSFDLVILGGGITGAGAALDAARRGWRIALIDKGDFASGTSSASSKLIHGGLRYLEYGHFSLVHEALRERALLLVNAPHLVRPLPFIVPFYRGQRIGAWQWRLGLTLYDLLAGRANITRSRSCSLPYLRRHAPSLRAQGLLGGALFADALMDDARLCLAVLQTAARHGACLANYVEAVGFEKHHGTIAGVWAHDRLGGEPFLLRGRIVLNATGPWGDAVARLAGDEEGPYLQPTKGVHLIVPRRHATPPGPPFPRGGVSPSTPLERGGANSPPWEGGAGGGDAAFVLLHPRDGRVFFVIPWHGKTLIGTTDTFADAGPDLLEVRPEEIAYLLEAYNHYFNPGLGQEAVMGSFAGLRPLMRALPGNPSAMPREFRLVAGKSGLVTVVGGKYTTFRQMAETIVDFLGQRLGRSRRCRTKGLPLEGTPPEPWQPFFERTVAEIQRRLPIPFDSACHLVNRYGNRIGGVLRTMGAAPDGWQRLHPAEPDLLGELAYQREQEMALFPTDLLLRRSRIGMYRPELLTQATTLPRQAAETHLCPEHR
jgi:glycerol-3-phosphate dehydrogenase